MTRVARLSQLLMPASAPALGVALWRLLTSLGSTTASTGDPGRPLGTSGHPTLKEVVVGSAWLPRLVSLEATTVAPGGRRDFADQGKHARPEQGPGHEDLPCGPLTQLSEPTLDSGPQTWETRCHSCLRTKGGSRGRAGAVLAPHLWSAGDGRGLARSSSAGWLPGKVPPAVTAGSLPPITAALG